MSGRGIIQTGNKNGMGYEVWGTRCEVRGISAGMSLRFNFLLHLRNTPGS
jgi:hypothetical protein